MEKMDSCVALFFFSGIGGVSCVASVFLPAWMVIDGKLYGAWDMCESGVCAIEGYWASLLQAFHVTSGTLVALTCTAAILKVFWALRHFPSDYLIVLASANDIIAGMIGILNYVLFMTLVMESNIAWAATLCIMSAVLIVTSGLFGLVIKATDTRKASRTSCTEKSAQVPLTCILQQQQMFSGNENSAFIYHNASSTLDDSASTDSGSCHHLNHNGDSRIVSHL